MTWWDNQGFDPQDPSPFPGIFSGGGSDSTGMPLSTPDPSVDMGYMGGQGTYTTQPVGDPISAGIVPNAGIGADIPGPDGTGGIAGRAPGAIGGQNVTVQQLQDLIGSDYSPQHLQQVLPQLQALGIEVQNQNRGDLRPRFRLPSGEVFDFGPGGWVPRGNMPPGFGDASQAPGTGGGGGGGGNPGLFGGGMMGGNPLDTLRNTPGYQFAKEQGLQGIERSAASRGTLLTGGTLKALDQYGTGLADQTYDSAYRRYLDLARLGFPGYPQ